MKEKVTLHTQKNHLRSYITYQTSPCCKTFFEILAISFFCVSRSGTVDAPSAILPKKETNCSYGQ